MATNTANQITILQSLQTLITNIETYTTNWRCGDPAIDAASIALLTTRLDGMMAALLTTGSRTLQAGTSSARAANNNTGAGNSADIIYRRLDDFMAAMATQIAVLQNPTSISRRVHTAGQ